MSALDPLDPARADRRVALFGGEGTVLVWDLGARVGALSAALHCELEAGGRVGKHVQSHDDEIVIVIGGEAVIYVQGRPHACARGSAVAVPLGHTLEIDNASSAEPVRYLIIKATANG